MGAGSGMEFLIKTVHMTSRGQCAIEQGRHQTHNIMYTRTFHREGTGTSHMKTINWNYNTIIDTNNNTEQK